MRIEIDERLDGKTVLDVFKKELKLSSKLITLLKKKERGIVADGARVTVRYILKRGDVLELETDDESENENLVPTDLPLDIIYEDDDIIVTSKPPMMPTHPSHGHFDDTLANAICFHMQKTRKEPFVFRSVNRLDRNTSGLVLVAKNRVSALRLYGAMSEGKIEKKYIAILDGVPSPPDGEIDTYIRRREKSIITREVCEPCEGAARALTSYTTLAHSDKASAVLATPHTGRTHQLRLHFAHMGAPVVGDDLYGKASEEIDRHALHSYYLSFPHPTTGDKLELTAPLPNDMEALLSLYNLKIEV